MFVLHVSSEDIFFLSIVGPTHNKLTSYFCSVNVSRFKSYTPGLHGQTRACLMTSLCYAVVHEQCCHIGYYGYFTAFSL